MNKLRVLCGVASVLVVVLGITPSARAGLTLTAQGVTDGFLLSSYATNAGSSLYDFLAAARLSDGNLAVVDYATSRVVKYADVDGQTVGSQLASTPLGGVVNILTLNGTTYVSQLSGGLRSVDSSLNLTPVNVGSFTFGHGLAADQSAGLLLAATGNGIYAVDPLAHTSSLISGSVGRAFDVVSVSPDGKTVYGATGDQVLGYIISTGALVFSYTRGGRGPDGAGVISGGVTLDM